MTGAHVFCIKKKEINEMLDSNTHEIVVCEDQS